MEVQAAMPVLSSCRSLVMRTDCGCLAVVAFTSTAPVANWKSWRAAQGAVQPFGLERRFPLIVQNFARCQSGGKRRVPVWNTVFPSGTRLKVLPGRVLPRNARGQLNEHRG